MPSKKSMRVEQTKTNQNKAPRSAAKTAVGVARRTIGAGEMQAATEATSKAASVLDKAAKRGAIHRNNAARRKGRLAMQLSRLSE